MAERPTPEDSVKQPDALDDDELDGVMGGRILAPQNSNAPLAGPDGVPLGCPA
jgi:hypothetical protein